VRPLLALAVVLAGCAQLQTDPEPWYPPSNQAGDPVLAVYEGRVPCTDPAKRGCDKVKLALVLYQDVRSGAPTTYRLAQVYVAEEPEGERIVAEGTWSISHGTRLDPEASVYQLDAQAPAAWRSYWAIGPDILFILDDQRVPRVGTASWSYVLNRTR
jgi:hypothetical protein